MKLYVLILVLGLAGSAMASKLPSTQAQTAVLQAIVNSTGQTNKVMAYLDKLASEVSETHASPITSGLLYGAAHSAAIAMEVDASLSRIAALYEHHQMIGYASEEIRKTAVETVITLLKDEEKVAELLSRAGEQTPEAD